MKIGIITFWRSKDNYGQILQCFALQQYLRENGHEPYLIRYIENPKDYQHKPSIKRLFRYIVHFNMYVDYLILKRKERKYLQINNNIARDFNGFIGKYITVSKEVYTDDDIICNPPEADAYICGSDQIWGGSEIFYLSFVPKGKIRIAYAPSLGGINPFVTEKGEKIKQLIKKFDFIGMRESRATDLLHKNGFVEATTVVDPTLLLPKESYINLLTYKENKSGASDVFVYLLGNPIVCSVNKIFNALKTSGLSYTYVASQGRVDRFEKSYLTIPQWIESISKSKMVITNSFHCVLFSLTFGIPFVFIPLSGSYARMNGRVEELLAKVNLSNRIFSGSFDVLSKSVDFLPFDEFKKKEQLRINKLLLEHLRF